MKDLEVGNPRFATKEDLMWYLLTVGTMIIVSSCLLPDPKPHRPFSIIASLFPSLSFYIIVATPQHICPHSAQCSQL